MTSAHTHVLVYPWRHVTPNDVVCALVACVMHWQFQHRIEVEQQSMEHQMGGLRSREKELLDRFLAIKDALQREMEESIAYIQRMDLLNAAAKREDAPSQPAMR